MAITTSTTYKTYAAIATDSLDDRIDLAILAAQKAIETALGVASLDSATYTDEKYSGDDTNRLELRNYPVTAISAIKWRDSTTSSTTIEATTYEYDGPSAIVWRIFSQGGFGYTDETPALGGVDIGDVWRRGTRNYMVTYTAGYSTFPADLVQIAHEMISTMIATARRDGTMQSESIGSYSYTVLQSSDNWAGWMARLQPYRRSGL